MVQVNSIITLFLAIQFYALFGVLVYSGIADYLAKRKPAALYWPVLMKAVNMVGLLSLTSLAAIDRLAHGGSRQLGWTWLIDPDVRMLAVTFYVGVMFGFAWFLAVILIKGRNWPKTEVSGLYATITLGTALIFIATIATGVFT